MSDTPRTDSEIEDARNVALDFEIKSPPPKAGENIHVVSADFARQLERELRDAKSEIARLGNRTNFYCECGGVKKEQE